MANSKKRSYSCIPDKRDDRDYIFKLNTSSEDLPESIDLRKYASIIEDQAGTGSCVSCAAVSLLEYLENKNGANFVELSRMFVYYNSRAYETDVNMDTGNSIRAVLRTIAKKGACEERLWKFREYRLFEKPTPECYADGLKHQILYYYRLYNVNDLRKCLAKELPAIIGIKLFESFESRDVEETGIVPMPEEGESFLGYHAVSIFGYTPDYFICRNSWGRNIAEDGYYFLLPEFIEKYGVDMWAVSKFEGI